MTGREVDAVFGTTDRYRLILDLDDRPGTVQTVSTFLGARRANIVELDSHTDPDSGRFYMRTEFETSKGSLDELEFRTAFDAEVGESLKLDCWELARADRPKRVCLLVSRYDHCLVDLLTRWRQGELAAEIDLVISNHPDLHDEVERFGVEYRHIPVDRSAKQIGEEQVLEVVRGRYDLLVLARYMQILSSDFLDAVGMPTINIHHSFLPAFAGADPYMRARQRGVKIIGATAHYVTADLDAGPIIEQDIVRVNHRASVAQMTQAGRDVERIVLARAVRWHLEDRVAVHGNSTVVFA